MGWRPGNSLMATVAAFETVLGRLLRAARRIGDLAVRAGAATPGRAHRRAGPGRVPGPHRPRAVRAVDLVQPRSARVLLAALGASRAHLVDYLQPRRVLLWHVARRPRRLARFRLAAARQHAVQ